MSTGCTSFYPVSDGSDLADYSSYDEEILIRLKDGTEMETKGRGIYYLEKDKIDSSRILEWNSDYYLQFRMKDHSRIIFNTGKTPARISDTLSSFFFIVGSSGISSRVAIEDVAEIQIQKTDNTKTILLIAGVVCLFITGFFMVNMPFVLKGPMFSTGGKGI